MEEVQEVPLPQGIVIKVPEGAHGASNAIPLLLELGAPVQFVHRTVGQKVERGGTMGIDTRTERYLHIIDCDSLAGSTSGAAQRRPAKQQAAGAGGAVIPGIEEQSESVQIYLANLREARQCLRDDVVLGNNVLVTDDVVCWPIPRILKDLVDLRALLLDAANEIVMARRLREALLRHTVEVVGSGTHPLTEEPPKGSTPIHYTVFSEKVKRQMPEDEETEMVMKGNSLIPGGKEKKKKKIALVKAQKQEKQEWHQSKSHDGKSTKQQFASSFEFNEKRYKKEYLSELAEDEDLLLTLRPQSKVASVFAVEFKEATYRFTDMLSAALGLKSGPTASAPNSASSSTSTSWILNGATLSAFKDMMGIGWMDLIKLHAAIDEREMKSLFGPSEGFKSPTLAKDVMATAGGALYSIQSFMRFEREGCLTNVEMMKLLARNSHQRLRLRNGVYATKVSFTKVVVVFKNLGLEDSADADFDLEDDDEAEEEVADGSPEAVKKKSLREIAKRKELEKRRVFERQELEKLTLAEVNALQTNFKISLDGSKDRDGNVKIVFNHSRSAEGGAAGGAVAAYSERDELVSRELENIAGKAHLVFSRTAKLSDACLANEYLSPTIHQEVDGGIGTKAKHIFVPGQDFLIVHGPRLHENYEPFTAVERSMTDSVNDTTLDPMSRGRIMRSIREFGDLQAEKRKSELQVVTDDHVEQLLTALFAEHGGRIAYVHAGRAASLRGVPPKQIRLVLKRMGHFDIRAGNWVKH